MRVLFAATSGLGHVLVLAPLVEAFRAAGHDTAAVVTHEAPKEVFHPQVQRFPKRVPSFPIPPHPRGHPLRAQWWLAQDRAMAMESYRDCLDAVRDFQPDFVIRESQERGAQLCAEKLGLWHATVYAGSTTALRPYLRKEADLVAPIRRALGLAPDPQGRSQVPYIGISMMAADFYGAGADIAPRSRFYRYPGDMAAGSPAAGEGGADPLILVSAGTTVATPHVEFVSRIARALDDAPVRVVAAVPDEHRLAVADEFPNIEVLGFGPLEGYIREARLVVSHGGFGTIKAALSLGVPMHITPFHSDQYFNAQRVSECGVGVCLPWEDCDGERLRTSLLSAADSRPLHERARFFARQMAALPDLSQCVRDICTLYSRDGRGHRRSLAGPETDIPTKEAQ